MLWPYAAGLAGPDGTIPTRIRPDGLHLSEAGVREVADAWLFDALGKAFRTIVGRHPPGLLRSSATPGPHQEHPCPQLRREMPARLRTAGSTPSSRHAA